MLIILLEIIFVLTCVFLILCVLLQSGKGGDVASAFGGSGSQTAFGPRGAQKPLEKATVISAIVFMLLALLFSLPGVGTNSVVSDRGVSATPPPVSNPAAAPSASPTASPTASPSATGSPSATASPAATATATPKK